ncbi:MAG: 28S ribosomal protein S35, mitochondrial [Alectoria sarmentosa]|nr:MAG: 28S ribosomal protein S35, mitochondrial [Alectoria sarmentosa]
MAAVANRLGSTALRYTSRIPARRKALPLNGPNRNFHTTPFHRRREDSEDSSPSKKPERQPFKFSLSDLDRDERSTYNSLSPEEREQWRKEAQQMHDYMTSPGVESELQGEVSQAAYETSQAVPDTEAVIKRIKPGLFSMGEAEEQDSGEDGEFEGDDITSLGHGELEQHREMRHYARIAAWEMPLLSKLAKPFTPPPLDHPLRFRYTTYMGETHPGSKKIVLEFCTRDLRALTEPQRIKLIKLVGSRYNPETDIVKMSSEMFETPAQNKRYLGDLVDTLIEEAKDETDTFEDVPLDFRHHKFKPKVEFPDRWKLTKEKREKLEEGRTLRMEQERKREVQGKLVEGVRVVKEAMKRLPVRNESRALLEAQQGRKPVRGKQRIRR